ncbi:MAG: hypothetical protein FIA97_02425 [Methylococcaceae bacterium]|nr:hypothetical protein [Methylococcaceae bacterium]
MNNKDDSNGFSRRRFLKLAGGGAAFAAASGLVPTPLRRILPVSEALAAASPFPTDADLFWAGTDGWISLPTSPAIGFYHPDSAAPPPFTTYIFGFRNITRHSKDLTNSATLINKQKMKAQASAPLFWLDEYDPVTNPKDFKMDLTNLGMQQRPDLFDSHTIHWHGFRNVIPLFDGEPTGSIGVPPGGKWFRYIFRPRDPGTYMYHCHVEDVEHVHMGMTGLVFVRPKQNGNMALYPSGKYAYNDGNGSTGYDREFALLLTEVWAEAHWDDAHIQLPDWTDYRADFGLINGRTYPDTLAPNSPYKISTSTHAVDYNIDANGDLPNTGNLQYQPLSSLVECNAGERVLLRLVNLGFREAAMTLEGGRVRVVGKDATPMRGRDGTDTSYETSTLQFGAGESIDAIFTAPNVTSVTTFVLYNRNFEHANNLAGGFGGQRTEIRVYPPGTNAAQQVPNQTSQDTTVA